MEYKKKYPLMFEKYKELCSHNLFEIGKLWLYKDEQNERWVLNFPTKTHWRYKSRYCYIEKGLEKFVDTYKDKGITSIAFPLLGCTNGGLDKKKVISIMIKYLSKCDIPIEIYEYEPTVI